MEKVNLGWLAGIIDGEGTICITKRKRSDGSCKFQGYQVSVRVANTDWRMIVKLMDLVNDGSKGWTAEARNSRCKKSYHWMVAAKKALALLMMIKDFLVCKKEEAEIAIEMQTLISKGKNYISSDEVNKQTDLFIKIKQLNKKGPERQERIDICG